MLVHDEDLPSPGWVHRPDRLQELCQRSPSESYVHCFIRTGRTRPNGVNYRGHGPSCARFPRRATRSYRLKITNADNRYATRSSEREKWYGRQGWSIWGKGLCTVSGLQGWLCIASGDLRSPCIVIEYDCATTCSRSCPHAHPVPARQTHMDAQPNGRQPRRGGTCEQCVKLRFHHVY